jgi:hypothetical protein
MSDGPAGDALIRGYQVLGVMDYIDTFGARQREQVYGAARDISVERASYDKMLWYPLKTVCGLYEGIASLHEGDEEKVYEALCGCGSYIAKAATNSFLRLFMKIMTPWIFARKVPDIYARDNRCGRMEVDTTDLSKNHIVVHLRDVAGYTHIGPVASGFGTFAMSTMGVANLKVHLHDWSVTTPAPPNVAIDMKWD